MFKFRCLNKTLITFNIITTPIAMAVIVTACSMRYTISRTEYILFISLTSDVNLGKADNFILKTENILKNQGIILNNDYI